MPLTSSDYLDFTSKTTPTKNPQLESGSSSGYAVDNIYRYSKVLTKNGITVDALVKIVGKDSTATLNLLDDDTSDTSAAIVRRFNPTVSTNGGVGGVLFEISFVKTGTSDPVYLVGFHLTAIDLDGSSSAQEYAEVAGFSSYEIGNPGSSNSSYRSKLTIYDTNSATNRPAAGRTRFSGINSSLNGVQFDNSASFIAHYSAPVQSISVVIGNTNTFSNGTGVGRQFSLNFGAVGGTFNDPATYPNADSPTITLNVEDGGDGKLSGTEKADVVLQGTTVKASVGDAVTLTVQDSAGTIQTYTTTVVNGGGYSKTVDLSAMAMGTITVSASVVNGNGNPSAPVTDTTEIVNAAPTATSVSVSGDKEVGQTLTGSYTYNDADNNLEATSTFKWYVGSLADGSDKTVVNGATGKTYTPVASDAGKYVFFEVTPIAAAGVLTGLPAVSAGYGKIAPANTAPTATSVSVSGDKEVGQTLTGSYTYNDADNNLEATSTFKWYVGSLADGSDKTVVNGATGKTYTPVASDAGKYIFFEVTPVAATGVITGSPAVSAGYGKIAPANAAPTATSVSVSGDKEVGQTLTGSYTYNDADNNLEATSTFKWYVGSLADGSDKTVVNGATGKTYTPVASDAGKYIFFEVTPVAATGVITGSPAVSAGYGKIAPANAAPTATSVSVSGDKEVGQTLTGSYTYNDADDNLEATSTFKWYVGSEADGSDKTVVNGATGKTYTPVASDAGKYVFFEVTPVAAAGVLTGSPAVSAGYGKIAPANTAPTATSVSVSGDKEVGQALTGSYAYNDADNNLEATSTFKWYVGSEADGSDKTVVNGATGKTYTPVASDAGKYVFFEVTPVAAAGVLTGSPAVSAGYGKIAPANTAPTATSVSVSGDKEVGQALTGSYTYNDADNNLEATSTFKWYVGSEADGSDKTVVNGATGKTYTPVASDAGKYIFFEVTPVAAAGVITGSPVVSDGYGQIVAANVAPVAHDDAKTTYPNTAVSGTLSATDADTNDDVTYSLNTNATHGTVVVNSDGSYTYTPDQGYAGPDSFTFKANDGKADSNAATVTITVANRKPIAIAQDVVISVNGAVYDGELHGSDPDTGDTLTFAKASDPSHGTVTVSEDGAYTYKPTPGFGGEDSFTFTVTDSHGATSTPSKVTIAIAEHGTYVIRLVADPDSLIGDGVSTSQLTATLTDSNAQPVPGVKIQFGATSGTFPEGDEAVTNAAGQAVIPYKTSKISSTIAQVIPVTADAHDTDKGIYSHQQINVTFQPAAIRGVVASTVDGQRVVEKGITVRIANAAIGFSSETTTDELGRYSIPVPEGDLVYTIEIIKPVTVGGETKQVSFKQTATVGNISGGGDEYFDSDKVATGIIVMAKPDGSQKLLDDQDAADRDMASQLKIKIQDPDTREFVTLNGQDTFALDPSGVFSIPGLVKGKKYGLAIVYSLPDAQNGGAPKEIIMNAVDNDGTLPQFKLSDDGELNILDELIDPYGDITDKVSGTAVNGANVVLYYADTPRNRAAGLTPGTEVVLPAIAGFAPNDNANPQTSKDGGKYAYMVYPQTDYYLVVTAAGYDTYVSPTIPVEFAIVRHDVPLTPQSSSPSPAVPATPAVPEPAGKPDLVVNVSIDRSTYEEGSTATVTVKYHNAGDAAAKDAQIALATPEGAEVTDAAGGTVSGGKIVWKPGTLEAGAGGQYTVKLKWPQIDTAERIAELEAQASAANQAAEGAAGAEASAKLLIFSNRYGNVAHTRYILGYPDKTFLPNRTLTRAELAAIIARLIDGGSTALKAQYSDVREGHWASGYIRIASDNGIFTGYVDGSFHPDSPVTREELAAVMVRYLKLKVAQPLDPKFADAEGRWSSAAIEALFRNALTTGYEDGTFKPAAPIVRQEAVTMINRLLYRGPLGGVKASFPDVPASSWSFGQIEEATRSHESVRAPDGSEIFAKSIDDNVR
ncbi:Ig-like domain-containing protein [Cohnella sp. JJ-181]|uniref:Ig-like domain-containing protein n=1 Tax=Cohnella rhizoplanae TaxID=2974897 RepID=UPI00232D6C99|nr:Ig-like domain-containing protein [Cohnella sp. JJ-181]